jgi:hypothetical protein
MTEESKAKAFLVCVCDKADTKVCTTCPKNLKISPDAIFNHPHWKRNLSEMR